jgi:multidrug efflux pump
LFRGELNANPAAGYSTGQTITAMEQLATKPCRPTTATNGPETALQELIAGNSALYVFPVCVLFVFLILAALYENWPCRWRSF